MHFQFMRLMITPTYNSLSRCGSIVRGGTSVRGCVPIKSEKSYTVFIFINIKVTLELYFFL
jgi:hypothetical protein